MARALATSTLAALTLPGWAPAAEAVFAVYPDRPKQTIRGLGFEIQSDSIGSGNHGLPEGRTAVPHDLVPAERERLAVEMLKGFRYCRLAGGLYWRGTDEQQKHLQPRWPEQLTELRDLLATAGVQGLSFEYWSPAPYWKGTRSYVGSVPQDPANRLRCFAPNFAADPDYRGDTDRFLADFAAAVVTDVKTLEAAGLRVSMFGLQNEPEVNHTIYSTCEYPDSASYVRAFSAVAGAVRRHNKDILIFADTGSRQLGKFIGGGMSDPAVAALVDEYAVHIVGSPSETPRLLHESFPASLPRRPWFQNEYEYLTGGATRERCLNTVQHIMNSFQLAENPTWFWIHALKPLGNAEASGYSLGFWKPQSDQAAVLSAAALRRWPQGPEFSELPDSFRQMELISVANPRGGKGIAWHFLVNQKVTVWMLVEAGFDSNVAGWEETALQCKWAGRTDKVFKRTFPAGEVQIPEPGEHSPAHTVFVEASEPKSFKADIGINLPIQIRSQALALEQTAAKVPPGHWIFNPYNWNAVGSFVRRMPWDSVALAIGEKSYNPDARILAFRKPNGKMTIVLSNQTRAALSCQVATGVADGKFKGYRYTPDDAGEQTMGVAIGELTGTTLSPVLPGMTWEFWEQQ